MDRRDALVDDRAIPRSALYRFIQCGRLCKNVMKQSYCSQIEILRQMKSEKIVVESLCDKLRNLICRRTSRRASGSSICSDESSAFCNKEPTLTPFAAACAYARRAITPALFGVLSKRLVVESLMWAIPSCRL